MATIKGKGFPTRKTPGALGDTYINVITNKKYKCVNAYVSGKEKDFEWKALDKNAPQVTAEPTKEVVKEFPKAEPEVKVEEPVKEPVKEAKKSKKKAEVKAEEPTVENASKRVDYAAAFDKTN